MSCVLLRILLCIVPTQHCTIATMLVHCPPAFPSEFRNVLGVLAVVTVGVLPKYPLLYHNHTVPWNPMV